MAVPKVESPFRVKTFNELTNVDPKNTINRTLVQNKNIKANAIRKQKQREANNRNSNYTAYKRAKPDTKVTVAPYKTVTVHDLMRKDVTTYKTKSGKKNLS